MLRGMPWYGCIFWSLLMLMAVLIPYVWTKAVFISRNGLFFKSWNRNAKSIRAEWSASKRIFLLHFWDKRVCSRYRVWFVFYAVYLVLIILLNVSQSINPESLFPPQIIPALPDIMEQVFVIQLTVLMGYLIFLLIFVNSVYSVVPPHKSTKDREAERTPIGRLIIAVIFFFGCMMFITEAILNIIVILEKM